jgi:hypothetical protein
MRQENPRFGCLNRLILVWELIIFMDFDLALRDRDRDALVRKAVPKGQEYVAPNIGQAPRCNAYPEPQNAINGTVSNANDIADRGAGARGLVAGRHL